MSMIFTEQAIVCPKGKKGNEPIVIDLDKIRTSEIRQDEVAIVTKVKAPELLAEFNRSWRELHQIIVQLMSEKNDAEKEQAKRKAVLLLGEVNDILKVKGVSSTADTREAVITLDEEYQALTDTVDQIEAVVEFLKGKMKSFENAYTSVKKILTGEDSGYMGGRNPNLGGDTSSSPVRAGFGKPAYARGR